MRKYLFFSTIVYFTFVLSSCKSDYEINRHALVTRHNIENSLIDSLNSLTVGNGDFAFTVDITGLQTFPASYVRGISLGTMSNWGWHKATNPENYSLNDVYKTYDVHGRSVNYVRQFRPQEGERAAEASEWLRANPHRIHLGMLGLQIFKEDGMEISVSDIDDPVQKLNLWTGEIESVFKVEGKSVSVYTICHPDYDLISVRIESDLIKEKRINVKISFPLGVSSPPAYDFNSTEKHTTEILAESDESVRFGRQQDNDRYEVFLSKNGAGLEKISEHIYVFVPDSTDSVFSFSSHFVKEPGKGKHMAFEEAKNEAKIDWEAFWTKGGAIDFSECTDPRAFELERRVVLSRYLTRIQCSGSLPPAETGLTYNSWYGKFHLEMHWWHAIHFALWQHEDVLEKQMAYYDNIRDNSLYTAAKQGYAGVRWPKMVGPDGRESPSTVGTYLIWQQPHPIFYSELLYENAEDKSDVLKRYKDLVYETADFMASYAWYDTLNNRYILGPVLIAAQESLRLETTINPPYELVYWYWGLKTALEWKKRLNEEPVPLWNDIVDKISELAVQGGVYLCSEDTKDSYINPRYMSDHPIVSAISGVMPETKMVDAEILANSLDTIMKVWNWETTWGWDFPMLAMSAASIGKADQALDFLMMEAPKNRYLINGHNYQSARLAIYLPGNGGLLTAVAKMCTQNQFPGDGSWNVRWEGLNNYVK